MALTKISSNEIQPSAITSDKISGSVSLGVKISNVSIANSLYTILDDTAVSTDGGYIVITGAGFNVGAQVIIGTTNATSVTRTSSTELRVQVPAKSAATYNLYVVNTDGSTGVRVNGLTFSGTPTWITASTLANVVSNTAFTGNLSATGATSYANTTSLPAGFNLVSANGYYYGNISVGSATTYSFTVRATDAELQDSDRTFSLTALISNPPTSVEYLVVAGGGGGGRNVAGGGGGGGAGGYRTGTLSTVGSTPYTVTVGGGGAGSTPSGFGNKGSDSVFSTITSTGGGAGAGTEYQTGGSGGSGGGGSAGGNGGQNGAGGSGNTPSTSPSQGNNGGIGTSQSGVGYGGGGGGGAGAVGENSMNLGPNTSGGGPGGAGSSSSISGSSVTYAGGGGGGGNNLGSSGSPGGAGGSGGGGAGTNGAGGGGAAGTTNTGGGGGGSYGTASFSGGSGIVIIRYADTYDAATSTTGSPTITVAGGYRIYQFTGSGSITF